MTLSPLFTHLSQDFRYAVRMPRKSPGSPPSPR
jgi:hypothetical protein